YLSGLLAKEGLIVLVALMAGQGVGGVVACELDKVEGAPRGLYIFNLACGRGPPGGDFLRALWPTTRKSYFSCAGGNLRSGRLRRWPSDRALRKARRPRGSAALRYQRCRLEFNGSNHQALSHRG